MRYARLFIVASGLNLSLPATAQAAAVTVQDQPSAFQALLHCRGIGGETERLSCFDRAAAALQSATQSGEVVIADRSQVRAARRSLFGLRLPSLPLLDRDRDGEDEVRSIESEAAEVSRSGDRRWIVRLQEGGTWVQTDDQVLGGQPRVGSRIVVNRAALGSFMMRVDGQPGIRVRRVN